MEAIRKIVEHKRQCPDYELEIRLGRIVGRRFENGVTRTEWHQILRSLCKYDGWAKKTDFLTRADYFYQNGTRLSQTFGGVDPPVLIKKTKIKSADIQLNGSAFACRIACANEHSEDASTVSDREPSFVRLKYMCTFTTVSGFRFDMSRVWQAPNLTAARQMVSDDSGSCEIEIELVDPNYVAAHDNAHVADSMLIKMNDLVAQFASQ